MVDYQPLSEKEMLERFLKTLGDISNNVKLYSKDAIQVLEDVVILYVPLKYWEIAKMHFSITADGSGVFKHGTFCSRYNGVAFIFIEHKENIFDSVCVKGVKNMF